MDNLLDKIGAGLALALLVCLFPMSYGYYTLIRFIAMIIFGCMAFNFYKNKQIIFCVIAGSLSLLFQPFFKMAFSTQEKRGTSGGKTSLFLYLVLSIF